MKYKIISTSLFKKELKNIKKRNKNLEKLRKIVFMLANGEKLDERYRDRQLVNCSNFIDCRECYIEPDWLLVYRIDNDKLILVLVETGSHSDLF